MPIIQSPIKLIQVADTDSLQHRRGGSRPSSADGTQCVCPSACYSNGASLPHRGPDWETRAHTLVPLPTAHTLTHGTARQRVRTPRRRTHIAVIGERVCCVCVCMRASVHACVCSGQTYILAFECARACATMQFCVCVRASSAGGVPPTPTRGMCVCVCVLMVVSSVIGRTCGGCSRHTSTTNRCTRSLGACVRAVCVRAMIMQSTCHKRRLAAACAKSAPGVRGIYALESRQNTSQLPNRMRGCFLVEGTPRQARIDWCSVVIAAPVLRCIGIG